MKLITVEKWWFLKKKGEKIISKVGQNLMEYLLIDIASGKCTKANIELVSSRNNHIEIKWETE